MHKLTQEGQQIVNDIAMRYGLSSQAVELMLDAVANGGGTMAQFNIPELGGNGQWMQGGMTMVGDMFNHGLKMTVDNLCAELSVLYFNQPQPSPAQASMQGASYGTVSLFVPGSGQSNWWPAELGHPASSGAQNNMRYAYFPNIHRLAVDACGFVAIYDTLDHQISGFSQQQSFDGSITFNSQFGVVQLGSLPRVDVTSPLVTPNNGAVTGEAWAAAKEEIKENTGFEAPADEPVIEPAAPMDETATKSPVTGTCCSGDGQGILEMIEKLGALRDKNYISQQEFDLKKADLLSRI